ncbi:MAG: hypothetical protein EOO14_15370 [Chitinophagaceae bacterium]|nr:MAG: hypothetical protein EOO14_15370 [Chitinophagaceae bacterium]
MMKQSFFVVQSHQNLFCYKKTGILARMLLFRKRRHTITKQVLPSILNGMLFSTNPMLHKKGTLLVLVVCFFTLPAYSQEVYHFKKGLAASISNRYGREALHTDLLAYRLYAKTLKHQPKAQLAIVTCTF